MSNHSPLSARPNDQWTLPQQPKGADVKRPRDLFAAPETVIGLRIASATAAGAVRTVSVWLYGDPPAGLTKPELWTLEGGPGTPPVAVTGEGTILPAGTDPSGTPVPAHLNLPIAAIGAPLPGRAPYRLGIDPAGLATLGISLDPLRRHLPVRLRPECGDAPDCVTLPPQIAPLTPPDYDTLARDYTALRAMLLERLQVHDPGADESQADLTVTLIELMAHLGDLLAYRQDRAATESWLPTARRRSSATRHARLVDFAVPPAASAETTVQVYVEHWSRGPGDSKFKVRPGDTATDSPGEPTPDAAHFTLETDRNVTVRSSHGEVALYDWNEPNAVLTAGATSAVLVRPIPGETVKLEKWLPAGSLLGFEVVAPGPPGEQEKWARRDPDANWPPSDGSGSQTRLPLASHPAQVVRVTQVVPFTDPLSPGLPLIRVFWDAADALRRPVPVSVHTSGGTPRVGVARLGLLPAHHGLCVDGVEAVAPFDPLTGSRPNPSAASVSDYHLLAAAGTGLSCAPGGRPWQLDTRVTLPSGTIVPAQRVTSLLRAPLEGFSVVVDHDDDEPPRLRFRTGALGLVPPSHSQVTVRYQVGAGTKGNISANTLTRLVRSTAPVGEPCAWQTADDRVTARNLTPGTGGAPAMPLDDVRRDAPQAYAAAPRRAVLVDELPAFATQAPGVSRAAAKRSWSGSWPVGIVAVEPVAGADPAAAARAAGSVLDAVRMTGSETLALPAIPVGLVIGLRVCLTPSADAATTRLRILAELRPGRAGAAFDPAALSLGTAVHTSAVVAKIAVVPGVDAVRVTEARRLTDPPGTNEPVLVMGPAELPVCDDDPAAPDRGRIELTIEGGR